MSPTYLKIITPHYNYELKVTETSKEPLNKFTFITGTKETPCLEGIIILDNNSKNNRYDSMANTASLIKIDALQACSLDDISDEYMAKYSFGTELIDSIVFFINSQFPSIKTVSLNDTSYIPCIRDSTNTLDLLIYSIALYKNTWYERKLNAYLKPKEKHDKYRKQVETYASKDTKRSLEFIDIYKQILKSSDFTQGLFDKHYTEFETMFNNSETLPEFFMKMSRSIERNDKCRFFKGWLEEFIESYVHIERTWYFDLYPKIEIMPRKNNTKKRNNNKY